jgi:phosphoesterase RecJ-like protein
VSREAVVEAIRRASRITAICHENPDADSVGSALALRIAAERLGKQAEVVAADPVPPSLVDLPGAADVRRTPQL